MALIADQRITLNVGGVRYEVLTRTLAQHPETLLGAMFCDARNMPDADDNNEYFFDRNGRLFEVVLDFYRLGGRLRIPPHTPLDLLVDELDFFKIDYSDLLTPPTGLPALPVRRKKRYNDDDDDDDDDDEEEDDDDDEEDEDEDEEVEIPDEWQIARGQGDEAMFRLASHKIWATAASRHDLRGGRALLLELVHASEVYADSDAQRAAARKAAPGEPLASDEPSDVPTNVERLLFPLALACWRLGDSAGMHLWLDRAHAAQSASADTSQAVRTLRLVSSDLRDTGVKLVIMVSLTAIVCGFLAARFRSH